MKKIKYLALIISTIFSAKMYAQSIELPDFVITGVQSVSIPTLQKERPKFITTLSKEFIKPNYTPEELPISEPSQPLKIDAKIFKEVVPLNGSLNVAAGINTQPKGEAYFYNNFDKINLYSKVFGNYTRAYENNSEINLTGVDFRSRFFADNKSDVMPGLKIEVGANYKREWYKKFMSQLPDYHQKIQNGYAVFSVENTFTKDINFGANLISGGLFTNSKDFREMRFDGSGFLSINLNDINLRGEGTYIRQYISELSQEAIHYDYYTFSGKASYSPTKDLTFGGGINLANYSDNSFFSPLAFVNARLTKNISAFFEFTPSTYFYTVKDFYKINRYLRFEDKDNVYTECKTNLNIGVKYEFEKIMSVSGGIRLKKYDNLFYFSDKAYYGDFTVYTVNDVNAAELYANYFFKLGDFGELFGDLIYRRYKTPGEYNLPYTPGFSLNTSYKYVLPNGIRLTANIIFNHDIYADETNSIKLKDNINLSLQGDYDLFDNFSVNLYFENITNNKNYSFINYLEKPLDIYAGITYKW